VGSVVWAPIIPDGGIIKPRRSIVIEEPPRDLSAPILVIGIPLCRAGRAGQAMGEYTLSRRPGCGR